MLYKKDIRLSFRGSKWLAFFDDSEIETDSLEELDSSIYHHFKSKQSFKNGDTVKLTYLFDNSSIPEWIRQYSNHYFNRKVELNY